MVYGIATAKITVTLRDDQITEIRALVEAGKAPNISAFVKHAVQVALLDQAGWSEMPEEALERTSGPLTQKERAWADSIPLAQTAEETFPKTKGRMSGVTFDAGGLIAIYRNNRRVFELVARGMERRLRITVPATALAQAIRNPARQALLARFIWQPWIDLVSLTGPDATAVGLLLARTGTTDIVNAHVVVCARRAG